MKKESEVQIRNVSIYNEAEHKWQHGCKFSEVVKGQNVKFDHHGPYNCAVAVRDAYLNDNGIWTIEIEEL